MWWDPDTIDRAVTRQFVCSHLLPDEIERLDRPLGFGDGLTDGTYWEWIDEKARRIFLILVDLGVPDQIFGVIDDSWDDEDLPVAKDQVDRLALTAERDEKMERRFYQRQFYYLLRPLQKGEHKVYQDNEVVPLDVVEKKTLAAGQTHNHPVDKVVLPGHPDMVFCRRRVPLACGFGQGYMSQEDFLYEVNNIRNVQNDHLVSYWASYVHQGYGYVLFTPATDSSLKSFLTTTPAWMKNLDKRKQRELVMNWIHCLVDTLCFLHNRGLSHGNIRPSTVLFSGENIFFSDFTIFNPEALTGGEKNSFDKEAYDYAAPEQWFRPTSGPPSPIHRRATLSMLSTSPDNHNFAISRSLTDYGPNSPMAMMHAPTPHLNPQAADVFSLGCVILELLSFLLKKQGRPFATYRAAKHKTPGRGGAVPDSSFHKNLGQVESWMTQLAKDASKKDDQVFRGVSPMLHVVERILSLHPSERPAAHDVQARLYNILTDACGISEPHCVHQYGGWDFGIGSLKLDSPTLVRNNSNDTMSIATKRSSGSGSSLDYKRMSGGSTTVRRTGSISTQAREAPPAEAPRDRTSKMPHDLGSSLRAIQNLRLRDKVRPWQSPVYAEMGVLTCNT